MTDGLSVICYPRGVPIPCSSAIVSDRCILLLSRPSGPALRWDRGRPARLLAKRRKSGRDTRGPSVEWGQWDTSFDKRGTHASPNLRWYHKGVYARLRRAMGADGRADAVDCGRRGARCIQISRLEWPVAAGGRDPHRGGWNGTPRAGATAAPETRISSPPVSPPCPI